MDRPIVYPGAAFADTDALKLGRFGMVALAQLAQAILGAGPQLVGLACTPGSGLQVSIAPGAVYQMGEVDATAYGSLGVSTTQVLKQGLILSATTLNCPAPSTSGQSINYLVEVEQLDVDSSTALLEFYNTANPTVPFAGPNNSGASSNTTRASTDNIQIKAGLAAATGSQGTPATDAGFVAAYVITVAAGQGSITTANIVVAPNAPFLVETLPQKVSAAVAAQMIAAAIAPLATFAELNAAVSAEAQRAETAEGSLSTALSSETSRAESAEGANAAAINTETKRALAAEALLAPLNNPALQGGTTQTQEPGDNSTKLASTAYVDNAVGAQRRFSSFSNSGGPWATWDSETLEFVIKGRYVGSITQEGQITVQLGWTHPNILDADADIFYNSTTASTGAQIASWTTTTLTVQIQDNQGNSAAAANGFSWEVWGTSPTLPAGLS